MSIRAVTVVLWLALSSTAFAQNATTPGQLSSPFPTLEHLSIEWKITGDDNNNGEVTIRYREVGESWRNAMPLYRVPAGSNESFSWDNRHAGTIFGLSPGTRYEVELTLLDPDGGSETNQITVETRQEPQIPSDAVRMPATPSTLQSVLDNASPNTVIELEAGSYSEITVPNDGEAGRPIVLVGTSIADVVINGDVRMDGRSHVWIKDMHVIGKVKFNNSRNIVVQGLYVETQGDGIIAYGDGTTDSYIADNLVVGSTNWSEASLGVNGDNNGEGIALTGPGNVIAYNKVTGFRDCISLLEGSEINNQTSIDIIGNDVDVCADDAIEADFSQGNVRVVRNRMNNSFIAMSSQPSLGGPTYFIRNVSYNNIFQAFKPNRGSIGDLWIHNTVVKPGDAMGVYAGRTWGRAFFRNNLFIGGDGGGTYNGFENGSGRPIQVADADSNCDFDFDGFGVIGPSEFLGRIGDTSFTSFSEMKNLTTEKNATEVDMSIFLANVAFPSSPFPRLEIPDLRLAAGSAAEDRGQVLANLNDGFAGAAPDLGAYEAGSEPPHYGPRGEAVCGNGVREGSEGCDDGNLSGGDGCDTDCVVEPDIPGANPDAGTGDANPGNDTGCGCSTGNSPSPSSVVGFFLATLFFWRRRQSWL